MDVEYLVPDTCTYAHALQSEPAIHASSLYSSSVYSTGSLWVVSLRAVGGCFCARFYFIFTRCSSHSSCSFRFRSPTSLDDKGTLLSVLFAFNSPLLPVQAAGSLLYR